MRIGEVLGGSKECQKEKTPAKRGFMRAAGPGFEPGLTDPESFSFRDRGRHGKDRERQNYAFIGN
jgi:hypothetical protein